MDLDKIKGSIIGLSLGDALGAHHEFKYQKDVYSGKLEYRPRFLNEGSKLLVIGQRTDDSEMMLTLLRSLLRNSGFNEDDVILSYLRLANSQTPMLDINTQKLFKGIKTLKGYKNR